MNKYELIAFREANPDDKSFIFATWLRGLRYGNDWFELIEKATYFRVYHAALERLLTSGVTIKVACLKDEPNVILGYAVYKGNRLDWVFVKKSWRGIGICHDLVPEEIRKVSHLTKTGRALLAKRSYLVFDPFDLT